MLCRLYGNKNIVNLRKTLYNTNASMLYFGCAQEESTTQLNEETAGRVKEALTPAGERIRRKQEARRYPLSIKKRYAD